jgi:hypothetical protein
MEIGEKVPRTEAQREWLKHLNLWSQTGQSLPDFAAKRNLSLKSLYNWKARLSQMGYWNPGLAPKFHPVRVMESLSQGPECRIHFPNGVWIEAGTSFDFSKLALLGDIWGRGGR